MRTTTKTILKMGMLTLLAALCLTACGGGSQEGGQPAAPSGPAAPEETEAAYVFETRGVEIAIDEDMADVLAALGEPLSYFEAASCAFDGLDKTYTYSGFQITTRPEGERDRVNSILLTDDSAATPEGVYIGCSADDVAAAYAGSGEDGADEWGQVLSCARGGTAMNFVLEDGLVVSIEYLPA